MEGGFLRKSVSDFSLLSHDRRLRAAQVRGQRWGLASPPHPEHPVAEVPEGVQLVNSPPCSKGHQREAWRREPTPKEKGWTDVASWCPKMSLQLCSVHLMRPHFCVLGHYRSPRDGVHAGRECPGRGGGDRAHGWDVRRLLRRSAAAGRLLPGVRRPNGQGPAEQRGAHKRGEREPPADGPSPGTGWG